MKMEKLGINKQLPTAEITSQNCSLFYFCHTNGDKNKEEMSSYRHVLGGGEGRKTSKRMNMKKPIGKRTLSRPKHKWELRDKDKWWAHAIAVVNLTIS